MTSKCGKNKKVAHEAIAECFTDVLTTFDVFCDLLLNRATVTWNLFVLYNNETSYYYIKLLFISKYFNITRKPAFQCSLQRTRKKDIWRDLISIQNEAISLVAMRIKEFWLVLDNHATVKPDFSVAPTLVQNVCAGARSLFSNWRLRMRTSQRECQFLS